jgi:hypothetical protein
MNTSAIINIPELYKVCEVNHLSKSWGTRFEGLAIQQEPEGTAVLSYMFDRAVLYGVFTQVLNLGLDLTSVSVSRPQDLIDDKPGTRTLILF